MSRGLSVFAGLAVTSHGLVGVMFWPSWTSAAPLLQILCFVALSRPV